MHKPTSTKGEHPTIQIGDVVVTEEGNMPRSNQRLRNKTIAVVQRPVSRLHKIEGKVDNVNSDIFNKDNVNKESDHSEKTSNRLKREAAIIGELKRKYTSDAM